MNRLLNIISNDLSIARYSGEADADFTRPLCSYAINPLNDLRNRMRYMNLSRRE